MTSHPPSDAATGPGSGASLSIVNHLPANPWGLELSYHCIRLHEEALKELQVSSAHFDPRKTLEIITDARAMLDRLMAKCDLVDLKREMAFAFWERGLQPDAAEAVRNSLAERIHDDDDGKDVLQATLKFYLRDPGYRSEQGLSLYGGAALCLHLAQSAGLDRDQILADALRQLTENAAAGPHLSTEASQEQLFQPVGEHGPAAGELLTQIGGQQKERLEGVTSALPELTANDEMSMSDREVTDPQRKRRYRLRRYRKELQYLRPVTPRILQELNKRAPGSAGEAREVICFAIENRRRSDDAEQLVVVAFGYDGTCRVVDLGYRAGYYDVEQGSHKIDLHRLKATIARRQNKWRNQEGNNLAAQLLIRFIVHTNNKLNPETGAYLQFDDASRVAERTYYKEPEHALKKQLKQILSAIIRTDSDIPSNRTYKVEVYFPKDGMLADYDDLRRHLLEDGDIDTSEQGVFTGDEALLTERFVALAWLAFHGLERHNLGNSTFVATTMSRSLWIGQPDDTDRTCGWMAEAEWWEISCRIPSTRNRRRSTIWFQKWIKRSLDHFKQSRLDSAIWDLDWAVNDEKRREVRRRKLLPWAERRWGTSNEGLLSALRSRSESDGGSYAQLCEAEVAKRRCLLDLLGGFAALPISPTPEPDLS
ncbi:MAG: hypothetical protein EXR12_00005 [Rhodospirillaceae bacterium]|nr:hypothetical protein [Rhodospirillaceae bacterium]